MNNTAHDYFSGAGGLSLALRACGWDVKGWEVMPEARQTRELNGLATAENGDVRQLRVWAGEATLQAAAPPCPTFSVQGKGVGRAAMTSVLAGVRDLEHGREPDYEALIAETGDERTGLVLEPLRLALEGEPLYVIWEQVTTVLPIWNAAAGPLKSRGYEVTTGVLDAAWFGAPQHRKRAVLLARRDGEEMVLPEATHCAVGEAVNMADALGWGMTHRPSYTVTGGGTYTGGAEPFGTAARKGMKREHDAGRWLGPERYRVDAREAAILQGFPNDYRFAGKAGKQHMQIGNAVPGHLARALVAQFPQPKE